MATVNVTDYGAVPNAEASDCAPAFLAAATAAGKSGTMIIGPGVWHILTYPEYHGAFPTVQADENAFIEYHLDTDIGGNPTPEALQKFLAYHAGFGIPYAWRCLGLGVEG